MAHLHMLTLDPDFRGPGELPSRILTFVRLRQFMRGETGTSFNTPVTSRKGDYDMALKGLLAIVYRYRQLLTPADVDFLLDHLMPDISTAPTTSTSSSTKSAFSSSISPRPRITC